MPDFSTISNEIWLIVIFFIYQIFNEVSVPSEATKRRKNNYLKNRYTRYYNKYNSLISERVNDKKIEALVYTIMLYEAFNRPKFVRIIENLVFKFKKTGSLGIMQVKSNNLINDKRSVEIGVEKILNDYNQNLKEREETSEEYIIRNTISNYNGGSQYLEEICELYDSITFYFYKNVHEKFKLSY